MVDLRQIRERVMMSTLRHESNLFPPKTLVKIRLLADQERVIISLDSNGNPVLQSETIVAHEGDVALVVGPVRRSDQWFCGYCGIFPADRNDARAHFRSILIQGQVRAIGICQLEKVEV